AYFFRRKLQQNAGWCRGKGTHLVVNQDRVESESQKYHFRLFSALILSPGTGAQALPYHGYLNVSAFALGDANLCLHKSSVYYHRPYLPAKEYSLYRIAALGVGH